MPGSRNCEGIAVDSSGEFDRWRQARVLRFGETSCIDCKQQIRGAVLPFGGEAFVEPGCCENDIRLDAGLVGECFQQRIDQRRLAVRIDVDLALSDRGRPKASDSREGETKLHDGARASRAKDVACMHPPISGFKARRGADADTAPRRPI